MSKCNELLLLYYLCVSSWDKHWKTQVREELEKQDQSELKVASLLPVLGTLVREGGNGMEEALARIRTVRGRTVLQCYLKRCQL